MNKRYARLVTLGAAGLLAIGVAAPAAAQSGELVIDSWRNDDTIIWEDVLIPAFNEQFPDISVSFNAKSAPEEYDAIVNSALDGGVAGDLITCRPFDRSLGLFEEGHLASLNDLEGMANFGDVAKSAWVTDDGSDAFCVPMASVIHGFIYNTEIFDELGLAVPATDAEFVEVLEAVKADGNYAPLVMGTKDTWEAATMGFQNIGPNNWLGEEGRNALIDGSGKLTDQAYVDTFTELAGWVPYLVDNFEGVSYPDAQQLFSLGDGAIYPAGSWDIAFFQGQGVPIGFFGPPVANAGDTCYISDHTDIAMGLNTASENAEAGRTFLNWVASDEFATLYSNALPGFYSLSNNPVTLDNDVAQQAVDLRNTCESTIRNSYQILSRGEPNLEDDLWLKSAAVINGTLTPEEAAAELQAGLDSWYTPGE